MIRINCTVAGSPAEPPTLTVDGHAPVTGEIPGLDGPGRCTFVLRDETPPWGAWLRWPGHAARVEIAQEHDVPLPPGDYEGALLVIPFPTLTYDPPPLRTDGDRFATADGRRWWWRGATDMLLPARLEAGEDIRPILAQRREAGATIVRSLAMGYPFWPSGAPARWETVARFFDLTREVGLYVEWVVFAGTRHVMPEPERQQAFWEETIAAASRHAHVLLELLNEDGHGSQQIDPRRFSRPGGGVLASHGSGLTDAAPVEPLWDFATYHPRRDSPPDARGFTNYDAYEFQAQWPKPCPYVPDEGIKPHQYGHDPAWAAQLGRHAAIGCGGTFHSDAGVRSLLWSQEEVVCARAFYEAVR